MYQIYAKLRVPHIVRDEMESRAYEMLIRRQELALVLVILDYFESF